MNQPASDNSSPKSEAQPYGAPWMRTIAMPADTNPNGDIFGGWLLSQMDLAGGGFARDLAGGRVVTVGIEAMAFHLPVNVGDQVSCYCRCVRTGTTSMTVHIETWVKRVNVEALARVTEGLFTYVAIDEQGNKRALPTNIECQEL